MAFDVQKQIKQNAQDIQNYYKDLYEWEDEIEQKNQNPNKAQILQQSTTATNAEKEIQIRGNANLQQQQATGEDSNNQNQQQLQQQNQNPTQNIQYKRDKNTIQDYYKAWDKFDVDEEMLKVDIKNQQNAKQLSEQAAKQFENTENKPKASAKQKIIVKGGRQTGLASINQLKDKANLNYRNADFQQALDLFTEAIQKLDEKISQSAMNVEEQNLKAVLYCNRSMTYIKLQEYSNAEKDASKCLELSPSNAKALYRRGVAKKKMGQLENALEDFLKAAQLDKDNSEIKNEINQVERTILQQKEQTNQKMIIEERTQENESIRIDVQDFQEQKQQQEYQQQTLIDQGKDQQQDQQQNQEKKEGSLSDDDDKIEEEKIEKNKILQQKQDQQQQQQGEIEQQQQLPLEVLEGSQFLKLKNIDGKFKKRAQKPAFKRYKSLQTGIKQNKLATSGSPVELPNKEPAPLKKPKISDQSATENQLQSQLKIQEVEDYDSQDENANASNSNQNQFQEQQQQEQQEEIFSASRVKFGGVNEEAPKRLSQPKLNLKPVKSNLKKFTEQSQKEKPKFLQNLEGDKNEKRRSLDMKIQEEQMNASQQKKQIISKFGSNTASQKKVISETKFTEIWNSNKNFVENRFEFLDSLIGEDLTEIFKEGIDFSLLFEIWKFFNDNYEQDKEVCQHYLENLYKIKRFEINMKALIKSEKDLISNFLTKLYNSNEISTELFAIYKEFL